MGYFRSESLKSSTIPGVYMPGWWRRKRLNHWFGTSSRVLVFAQIVGAGIMTDHEKWHIFKSRFVWKFCTQLKRPINQWGPSFIGQTLLGSMMQWLFQDQQPSWLRNIKIFDHKAQQGDTHWAAVFVFFARCCFKLPKETYGFAQTFANALISVKLCQICWRIESIYPLVN